MLELSSRFEISETGAITEVTPRYNIAPGQAGPVVLRNSPNHLEMLRWGLVPSWAKDPKVGYQMINARSEGIEQKSAFRKPLLSQRCIIPANGFYEWRKVDNKHKIPYYFTLKAAREQEAAAAPLFGFAGLYDFYTAPDGTTLKTYTIITTTANELVGQLHERMPVILAQADEATWLNPALQETEPLLALLKPYPAELMTSRVVSALVNKPQNEGSQLLEPSEDWQTNLF
jgi:putative SOS response-associated peptidase YedK